MGREKATKVVRKKGRSPLIFQFQMRCTHFSPTMQMPGIRFFRGGEWGGGSYPTEFPFKLCWSVNKVLASTEERGVDICWCGYSHLSVCSLLISVFTDFLLHDVMSLLSILRQHK